MKRVEEQEDIALSKQQRIAVKDMCEFKSAERAFDHFLLIKDLKGEDQGEDSATVAELYGLDMIEKELIEVAITNCMRHLKFSEAAFPSLLNWCLSSEVGKRALIAGFMANLCHRQSWGKSGSIFTVSDVGEGETVPFAMKLEQALTRQLAPRVAVTALPTVPSGPGFG